jgi:hypothetical protein
MDFNGRKFSGPLPSLEVFKLARLSKHFYIKILEIFKPMKISSIGKFHETM